MVALYMGDGAVARAIDLILQMWCHCTCVLEFFRMILVDNVETSILAMFTVQMRFSVCLLYTEQLFNK